MTTQPVTILSSEIRMMDSKYTGRQYRITISLPLGYSASPDEGWPFNKENMIAQCPVVYVLDCKS